MDFVDERDNALIGRVGGRWDRLEKRYVDDAPKSRIVRLHRGQLDAADWFLNYWLERHYYGWGDDEFVSTMLGYGGRRSGKSYEWTALQDAYAVAVPASNHWIVVPSDIEAAGKEIMAYQQELLPRSWYSYLGSPHYQYELANGSTIRFLSGFTPSKVKQGKASTVFINEAQQVKQRTYSNVSASAIDTGGLVMCAANPPNDGDAGRWVADVISRCANRSMPSARTFFLDPRLNPHIDQHALEALREKYSERDYEIEVLGRVLVPSDTVLHAWDHVANERPAPDLGACTPTFTQKHEGRRFKHVVGVDVQKYPWLVAVVGAIYPNPEAPVDMDDADLWLVDEVYVDKGDEVDLAIALKSKGYDPAETLIVCDASGRWQQAERRPDRMRPQFTGGHGSWDMFRAEGFVHVVGPDRDLNGNPDVIDRVRAANARIGSAARRQHVFADPRRCPRTVGAIGEWRMNPNGHPSRTTQHAHAGDALTYLIWRWWARRFTDPTPFAFKALRPFHGARRVRGF